ncbi:hypothetical protein [Enterovirga sp. CN4-39]|uniref:hypothetical protein n=1 Tax=Enterovirga sp. CN4-39 TaxID=3400910 RepID=UPI003C0E64AD
MPAQWLRQPHRIRAGMFHPLTLLAAAFVLLWAVVLQPVWETSRERTDPSNGPPALALRATQPT